jgi:cytochrome c
LAAPTHAENHMTGDAAAGEEAFARQCVSCHVVVNEMGEKLAGRNAKTGPNLYGVVGRASGTFPGFRYGASIVMAGEAGILWNEENFVGYALDPTSWLRDTLEDPSARSRMTFKVRKETDAADIYAFLASIGPKIVTDVGADAEEVVVAAVLERPVSYSSEQVDRGAKRYKAECADCHGADLKGGMNGGATIRSVSFLQKYGEGAPASVLFQYLTTAMPPNAPGRYSATTYADLMAYILKRNGFSQGAPLPADLDALDDLMMTK